MGHERDVSREPIRSKYAAVCCRSTRRAQIQALDRTPPGLAWLKKGRCAGPVDPTPLQTGYRRRQPALFAEAGTRFDRQASIRSSSAIRNVRRNTATHAKRLKFLRLIDRRTAPDFKQLLH